jgi:hypothetical protein
MKTDRRILTLLIMALLASLPASGRAQDATTSDSDTAASDSNTNTAPTLKDLMDASDQVTNTAGMVLVKISPSLWAGMYEVTQDAYQQVMGSNPSAFPGPDHPVDSVTWNNAMAFCKKLTETEQTGASGFRVVLEPGLVQDFKPARARALPSPAIWAARAWAVFPATACRPARPSAVPPWGLGGGGVNFPVRTISSTCAPSSVSYSSRRWRSFPACRGWSG